MRDLLASAVQRTFTGWSWLLLALGGVAACMLAAVGFALSTDGLSAQEATDGVARVWFTLLLFSALWAANVVTRDHATGAVGRIVHVSGSRARGMAVSMLVSVGMGLAYGVLAGGLAAASPWVFLRSADIAPVWGPSTTHTVLGVFVVTALAAPWGAAVGWLVRSQVGAIGILLVQALLVDELVQHIAPRVGRYALTMAMGSVYGDGRPGLLAVPAALAVIVVWLAVGTCAAWAAARRRDVL